MVAGRLQEKNGFYYIVLSYTDSAGKRRQPWIGTGLPVKGNKKRAEKMHGAAVEQLFEQFVLSSHSHPHFPVLLEFCNLIFPKKGRCPSWGLPPRGSFISQLIIQR